MARRRRGFLETPRFYSYLSGRRNLHVLAGLDRGDSRALIDQALDLVGLQDALVIALGRAGWRCGCLIATHRRCRCWCNLSGVGTGAPNPVSEVADNDLAVGRMIDTISHSKFWASSAVLVVDTPR